MIVKNIIIDLCMHIRYYFHITGFSQRLLLDIWTVLRYSFQLRYGVKFPFLRQQMLLSEYK